MFPKVSERHSPKDRINDRHFNSLAFPANYLIFPLSQKKINIREYLKNILEQRLENQ
jgi:hypothetical protein